MGFDTSYINPSSKWQSVACSGAEIGRDYRSLSLYDKYYGQDVKRDGPRLYMFKDSALDKLEDYIAQASSEYIPGRIHQLEFVKEHQPKTITLTGSGNDVGFGDIIEACVIPNISWGSASTTCDYASLSSEIVKQGQLIQDQYQKLVDLYNNIHELSPNTKIYAVGYPQFVSSSNEFCDISVGLDQKERSYVRDGVTYLNKIIRAAANKAGVMYIDVEDSFGEHVLCGDNENNEENESYVNAINLNCTPIGLFGNLFGTDECQESFHPNYKGHIAMAEAIKTQTSENLLKYEHCTDNKSICPTSDPPDISPIGIFEGPMNENQNQTKSPFYIIILRSFAQKASQYSNMEINADGLEPGSQAQLSIHSDPVDLGTYTVGEDGTLSTNITIPDNIPAGYHTLHLEAKTRSGEDIDLRQIITVYGKDGDIDEDSIPDDTDTCLFITASGVDADNDGIDDACDVEIRQEEQVDDGTNDGDEQPDDENDETEDDEDETNQSDDTDTTPENDTNKHKKDKKDKNKHSSKSNKFIKKKENKGNNNNKNKVKKNLNNSQLANETKDKAQKQTKIYIEPLFDKLFNFIRDWICLPNRYNNYSPLSEKLGIIKCSQDDILFKLLLSYIQYLFIR